FEHRGYNVKNVFKLKIMKTINASIKEVAKNVAVILILTRHVTGTSAKNQRKLTAAVKCVTIMALLHFVFEG
ncbi:hypothetical protein GSH19_05295, partial [Lactobacillus sp. S2-2]